MLATARQTGTKQTMHRSRICNTAKWFGLEINSSNCSINLSQSLPSGVPPLLRLLRNPEQVQLLSSRVHRLHRKLRTHLGQHVSPTWGNCHRPIRMCGKCIPTTRPGSSRVCDMPIVLRVSCESMNEEYSQKAKTNAHSGST